MEIFASIVRHITKGGTVVAGAFLVGAMLIVVTSVTARSLLNIGIIGSSEVMELMMAIVVAFALAYTALRKGHVKVDIIVSRFSVRIRAIVSIAISFLTLAIFGLMSAGTAQLVYEKGLREFSETLDVPYFPFRSVFILGLLLFSLSYIFDIFEGIKKVRGKWTQ